MEWSSGYTLLITKVNGVRVKLNYYDPIYRDPNRDRADKKPRQELSLYPDAGTDLQAAVKQLAALSSVPFEAGRSPYNQLTGFNLKKHSRRPRIPAKIRS